MDPTHYDLFILIVVLFGLGLLAFGWVVGYLTGKLTANFGKSHELSRATAGLIYQEAEKIRQLVREWPPSP